MRKYLEGKYFAFVFRADFFASWRNFQWKKPVAIYQVKNGVLKEAWHPCNFDDEINFWLFDFLKENKINKLYTLKKNVKKFGGLNMYYFEKEHEFGVTWFRYWPLIEDDKKFESLRREFKENNIELKCIPPYY